jgi:hypothetical protein
MIGDLLYIIISYLEDSTHLDVLKVCTDLPDFLKVVKLLHKKFDTDDEPMYDSLINKYNKMVKDVSINKFYGPRFVGHDEPRKEPVTYLVTYDGTIYMNNINIGTYDLKSYIFRNDNIVFLTKTMVLYSCDNHSVTHIDTDVLDFEIDDMILYKKKSANNPCGIWIYCYGQKYNMQNADDIKRHSEIMMEKHKYNQIHYGGLNYDIDKVAQNNNTDKLGIYNKVYYSHGSTIYIFSNKIIVHNSTGDVFSIDKYKQVVVNMDGFFDGLKNYAKFYYIDEDDNLCEFSPHNKINVLYTNVDKIVEYIGSLTLIKKDGTIVSNSNIKSQHDAITYYNSVITKLRV